MLASKRDCRKNRITVLVAEGLDKSTESCKLERKEAKFDIRDWECATNKLVKGLRCQPRKSGGSVHCLIMWTSKNIHKQSALIHL